MWSLPPLLLASVLEDLRQSEARSQPWAQTESARRAGASSNQGPGWPSRTVLGLMLDASRHVGR